MKIKLTTYLYKLCKGVAEHSTPISRSVGCSVTYSIYIMYPMNYLGQCIYVSTIFKIIGDNRSNVAAFADQLFLHDLVQSSTLKSFWFKKSQGKNKSEGIVKNLNPTEN